MPRDIVRWREDVWPPVVDDPAAARIAGFAVPLLTLPATVSLAHPGTFQRLMLAALCGLVTARVLWRLQAWLWAPGHLLRLVSAPLTVFCATLAASGAPIREQVFLVAGSLVLSEYLFVGGRHPLDRYLNLGWAAFSLIPLLVLASNRI